MARNRQVTFGVAVLGTMAAAIAVGIACCHGSPAKMTPDGGSDALDLDLPVDRPGEGGGSGDATSDGPRRVLLDPRQACQGTGALADQSGACSVINVGQYTTLGVAGFAYGSLPACAHPDPVAPGYTVSILLEQIMSVPQTDPALVGSSYLGRNKPATGDCGIRLDVTAYRMIPSLKVGDEIQLSSRIVSGTKDTDVTLTISIRAPSGRLLLAAVTGARPGRVEADLLDGLTLAVQDNLCSDGNRTMVRVTFTDGAAGQCALDAMTQRCCTMWQASYAVRSIDAFTSPPGMAGFPSPWVTFEIARSDFWQSAP